MRIAFLCKRSYMSKDVILDRYARLYEIPRQLANIGHDVLGVCLSYQGHEDGAWNHEGGAGQLRWQSKSFKGLSSLALLGYPWRVLKDLKAFNPDILIAASDIPHLVLGRWLSSKLGIPFVADLYDNFEGFGQARIPGFKSALRSAVKRADLVTTTSVPLREFVVDQYGVAGRVVAMPSAVDRSVFYPRNKIDSRERLGLPLRAKLVGTAGGLYLEKGIDQLYSAWSLLKDKIPDLHLVLAGPIDSSVPVPVGDRVHYLGMLPHESVADLFCALDVGVMCVPDTEFGRYCFPQKAYEMLACRLPVVATAIGAMCNVLSNEENFLYSCDDVAECAQKISLQVERQELPRLEVVGWEELIAEMNFHICSVVRE